MKNKFSIILLAIFLAFIVNIIILNIFNSSDKKTYYFDRKISNKDFLTFKKANVRFSKENYVNPIYSDNFITEFDEKPINDSISIFNLYQSDFDFKKIDTKSIQLRSYSQLLYCNEKGLFFYPNPKKLFYYIFSNKQQKQIPLNGKVFAIKQIKDNHYLCLGELKVNNSFQTCFFNFNIENSKYDIIKNIETNLTSKASENSLRYSGNFSNSPVPSNDKFCYYCDKSSFVYIFNSFGIFEKTLITNDKTPLPKLTKNSEGYIFYSRDGTWVTNYGTFFSNDKIFVFSSRYKGNKSNLLNDNNILIDVYNLVNYKYIESYSFKYKNYNTSNIYNIYMNKKSLLIVFENEYCIFNL